MARTSPGRFVGGSSSEENQKTQFPQLKKNNTNLNASTGSTNVSATQTQKSKLLPIGATKTGAAAKPNTTAGFTRTVDGVEGKPTEKIIFKNKEAFFEEVYPKLKQDVTKRAEVRAKNKEESRKSFLGVIRTRKKSPPMLALRGGVRAIMTQNTALFAGLGVGKGAGGGSAPQKKPSSESESSSNLNCEISKAIHQEYNVNHVIVSWGYHSQCCIILWDVFLSFKDFILKTELMLSLLI
jgi:hypothetical protein